MPVLTAARSRVCALLLFLALTAGCSAQSTTESNTDSTPDAASSSAASTDRTPATQAPKKDQESKISVAATAKGEQVTVLKAPDGKALEKLENPTATDVPLTFMVMSVDDDWVRVQLPVRPNGSTGWVAKDEVTLSEVPYHLKVSTDDKTLKLYEDDSLKETFSVATGTGDTPTPLGTFYLTELIEPTNDGYGPFAYGISAFSDVLNEFGGGPGQIGLHGTDKRDSIGEAISKGCIRLANEDITMLSELLPLGTPIVIT